MARDREIRYRTLKGHLDEAAGDLLGMAPEELQTAAQDDSLPEWQRFNAASFGEPRNRVLTQILTDMPAESLTSLAEYGATAVSIRALTENDQKAFEQEFSTELSGASSPEGSSLEAPRITYRLEEESDLTAVKAGVEAPASGPEETILKCRPIPPSLHVPLAGAAREETSSFERVLEQLARKHRLNIVADARDARRPLPDLKWEEVSLEEAIQALQEADNSVDKEGQTLRIRSQTWYLDRVCAVPRRIAEALQKMAARQESPAIEDYARWATQLNPYQLEAAARIGSPKMPAGTLSTFYRPLRLLGMLSSRQQQKAIQEGLRPSDMTPDQQRIFYDLACEERPQATPDALLHARFAFRKDTGERITFIITYDEGDRQSYSLELP